MNGSKNYGLGATAEDFWPKERTRFTRPQRTSSFVGHLRHRPFCAAIGDDVEEFAVGVFGDGIGITPIVQIKLHIDAKIALAIAVFAVTLAQW